MAEKFKSKFYRARASRDILNGGLEIALTQLAHKIEVKSKSSRSTSLKHATNLKFVEEYRAIKLRIVQIVDYLSPVPQFNPRRLHEL